MSSKLTSANATHALIIGVNDYGGKVDLEGSVPDAMAWVHIALEMGIPGCNITVLSRPVLDASAWPDDKLASTINFGDATRDTVIKAARVLAAAMDVPNQSKALVTFSGHGSWDSGKGALLVPADGADDTDQRVALDDLLDVLDRRAKGTDVTFFLDSCHAGRESGAPRAQARTLLNGTVPSNARLSKLRRGGDIMISATQPQSLSHEIQVGGEYRGAFSWAVTSLLDRWGVRSAGIDPDFDISYTDLLDRANQLLTAMEVAQPPQYDGPAWARPRAVLSSRLADAPDGMPDDGGVREIDPSTGWYQIETSAGDFVGGVTFSTSEQQWTWDLDKVSGPFPSGLSLTLTKQSSTFNPPKNKLVQTFENHNGLKSGTATITPDYKVSGSGSSHTYYMKFSTTSGLTFVANTANNLSGSTLTFDVHSSGSVTKSHHRVDGFK